MIKSYWMWQSLFWFIELIFMPNASNSVHPYFRAWNVILNSLSARKIHVHFHNVSIVKLYVHTKGTQIYTVVCVAVHWGCLPTSTVESGRVGSNRVQSDSQSQGKCTPPGSSPIWLKESGEVHSARFESNLTHRVRGSAHRPGRVQSDSQSQSWCTPPGSSQIWLKESGEVHSARVESNMTYRVRGSALRRGRAQSNSKSQGKCTAPGSSPIQPPLTQKDFSTHSIALK